MPAYTGTGMAVSLQQNRTLTVFNNEPLTVGVPSIAAHLIFSKMIGTAGAIAVAVKFSADPGAYALTIEASDDDSPLDYVAIGGLGPGTSTLNANFATRTDLQTPSARFIRVTPTALPNAVTAIVTIARN